MTEDTYCRLCAMKIENCIKIYDEEGEKLNLATKIIQCLQIWLYPEDVLPKTVCADCCSKVNLFFDFFQICSQSQISLMSMFKEKDDEEKIMMNDIEEVTDENNVDHEYEDDCNSYPREEAIEYTDLAVPEKSLSKRKLRTPIKRSIPEGTIEIDTNSEQTTEQTQQPSGKKDRRCKNMAKVPLIGHEDDEEEETEDEEGPKLSAKGLEGYEWKCTDCEQELKTLAELRRHHAEIHNQGPVFACRHCSKNYTRYRSFARHVKMHSNPKKFSCEICGKCFSQKTVLQSHATVHSDERPHSCAQCGKCFKQFSSLYLHSKCHLPEQAKPKFPCTQCPKEFSTKHTLETHFKIHTGERNFVCDMCGKRFIAKGSLDYHILTHNDTKPHSCTICGKGFKTARLLAKHSTLHTGVKPHQCDVCGKQFRERGALKEHNRIHTGAMPYSCEYCGKLFRFKGILTVHRRQHTGERPYSCTECRREFTNWANYNKHMKRRHRNSEHNSLLASRLLQRQVEHVVVHPAPAPPPPTAPPAPSLVMHPIAPPVSHYDTTDTTYKVVEEEIYRVPNYVPSMGYYIPPLQHTILQSRSQ